EIAATRRHVVGGVAEEDLGCRDRSHRERRAPGRARGRARRRESVRDHRRVVRSEIRAAAGGSSQGEMNRFEERLMSTEIHQEIRYAAQPIAVYECLLDAPRFTAMTGAPAEISPEEGGAFSCFG